MNRQLSLLSPVVGYFTARRLIFLALYLVIVVGSVWRVYYVFDFNPIDNIFSDTQRHWEQGTEVFRTDPMTLTDPVVYQIYIGALAKLSLKIPELVAFYTALLSLLMPWFWYRFMRELQPSKLAALAGWAAITWLPSWNNIYAYFMQETLMLPLLGAALWMTWRCRRKRTVGSFAAMVLLWAVAGITRSTTIPMAIVATLFVWWNLERRWKGALYAAAIVGLILAPLSYRSMKIMNIVAPWGIAQLNMIYGMSGKKEVNIYYSNNGVGWLFGFMTPSMLVEPLEPLSHWKTRRDGLVTIHIDIQRGMADWNRAIRENFPTWERYRWLVADNLILLFFNDSWPDSNRELRTGEINYQMRWIWAPLTLLCLALCAVRWRSVRRRFLLSGIILAWFAVQGLLPMVANEGRYRKPLEGFLIAQFVLLAGTWREKRRPELTDRPPMAPPLSTDNPPLDVMPIGPSAAALDPAPSVPSRPETT